MVVGTEDDFKLFASLEIVVLLFKELMKNLNFFKFEYYEKNLFVVYFESCLNLNRKTTFMFMLFFVCEKEVKLCHKQNFKMLFLL